MVNSLKRRAAAFATATAHGIPSHVCVREHLSQFGQALSKAGLGLNAKAPRANPGRMSDTGRG